MLTFDIEDYRFNKREPQSRVGTIIVGNDLSRYRHAMLLRSHLHDMSVGGSVSKHIPRARVFIAREFGIEGTDVEVAESMFSLLRDNKVLIKVK